ncbi:MAG TPA: Ppx/GppA family phosphatase [Allosphingosinicella sp.]|jgi:exopolyphosphatase/guanosine-5'-triphosphate,3'-diphosphate pyrophosphatase
MTELSPIAIVDIGSNSVRLVVYSGASRIPSIVFNEKVMAGLGRGLNGGGGELPAEAQERALAAIARFRLLLEQMGAGRTRVVATAAVRDASNGAAFLDRVRALGVSPEILSGEEEGVIAGLGVLSSIPDADGIVGDLGGGSLELVDISGGAVRHSASLPLGVLRLGRYGGKGALRAAVEEALARTGFARRGEGRRFYMVGGSWRTLARVDMALRGHPLPIVHQHALAPERPRELQREIERLDKAGAARIPSLSMSRLPTLPAASRLLRILAEALRPAELVVSSFGIREGLLYADLEEAERRRDPLIAAARDAGLGLGRFEPHGGLLDRWIAPVFDDGPEMARLRLAACLLADVAWQAHPDFRAERGLDMALHGNWVGIDAAGRVMLAQALYCSFGGGRDLPDGRLSALCSERQLSRASQWGLAMRLGQRLSGGAAAGLERSRLAVAEGRLILSMQEGEAALYGEAVDRRLKTLAGALGLRAEAALG